MENTIVSASSAVSADDYTVVQLKGWLSRLNLSTQGTKAALVARLNEVPYAMRGEPPLCSDEAQQQTTRQEDNDVENISAAEHTNNEIDTSSTQAEEIHTNGNVAVENNSCSKCDSASAAFLAKEMELLRLKIELLEKERELNAHQQQMERATSTTTMQMANNSSYFHVAKDMLPDYSGGEDFNVWMTQIKNVKAIYNLDDNMLRMIVMSKIKNVAQQWLYSKPNVTDMPLDVLFLEMHSVFGQKESKLTLRKKFELRHWKVGEKFIVYYNDKMRLAADVAMDNDELVECLVAGIPDEQLRVQAHIQRFQSTSDLLQAFRKVELNKSSANKTTVRCYNCNYMGHFAANCVKPKREYGECYGCGSRDHRVLDCPQRRTPKNNYNAS